MRNSELDSLVDKFLKDHVVRRIWDRDVTVWGASDPATVESIRHRLGWLESWRAMPDALNQLHGLANEVSREHISAVYLLGMGGSSLSAEVIRAVYGVADWSPGSCRSRHHR
jgi:hypothetical protein